MLKRPESHARAPHRPKRVSRRDPGGAVLGTARDAASNHLALYGVPSDRPLTERIRDHVYDAAQRRRYVAMATRHLREKRPDPGRCYDVLLVGAGVHAATFLTVAKPKHPELDFLVVERSDAVCATFAQLGDSLILNSPTSSKVGLDANVAPGHFVQLSDFDELAERTFPTAKHLYELAAMMLLHADADVAFDFEVSDVARLGEAYRVSAGGLSFRARAVVIANGMGEARKDAFTRDRSSARTMTGDAFIRACHDDAGFLDRLNGRSVAIVGAGDTANCAMECLLPLTYPRREYQPLTSLTLGPKRIYWVGQRAKDVRDYYFANKQRYCYSGGLIECFWDGETPFDLPAEVWSRSKSRIAALPEKLMSLRHGEEGLELEVGKATIVVDLVVDCTGRVNALRSKFLEQDYAFIEGDTVFPGGRWDLELDRYVIGTRHLAGRRIACQRKGEPFFLLGTACPLCELIDDEEARDGTLRHQDTRTSITNSKWSLEHTLPRTVAFAEQIARYVPQKVR